MKMDFSKFKKIKSDGRSTTLKHAEGHKIIVAHHALSPKYKKQLADIPTYYANGGEVEEVSEDAKKSGKKFGISERQLAEIRQFDVPKEQKSLEPMGPVKPEPQGLLEKSDSALGSLLPGMRDKLNLVEWQRGNKGNIPVSELTQPIKGPAPASMGPPQAAAQPMAPAADTAGFGSYMKGLGMAERGLNQAAAAEAEEGKMQALAAEKNAASLQSLMEGQQKAVQDGLMDYEKFKQDYMNGKIEPQRYWDSMSGGKKVMTAIGLILGGIGSGMTRGENLAAKMLQENIRNDIEAQKAEMGKKANIMSASMQMMGNVRDATQLATALQMNIYSAKLQEAAAKSKDPQAKARAMLEAGKLYMGGSEIIQKLYTQRYQTQLLKQSEGNPVLAIQVKVPEKLRENALKELYTYREIEANLKQVRPIFENAFKNTTLAENIKNPIQAKRRLETARAELFPVLKSILGEKMSETDAAMIDKYLPDFYTNEKTMRENLGKMERALLASAQARIPILSEYGIVSPLKQTPRTKTVKGVVYMEGPNGEAIPVK